MTGEAFVLKARPEDFLVVEVADHETRTEGEYALCLLEKRLVTTESAAQRLARFFSVDRERVGYAGLKDKKAVTTQYVTVKGVDKEHVAVVAGKLSSESESVDSWLRLSFRGFVNEPLHVGDLQGNTFTIIVRGLSPGSATSTTLVIVPNYYDEQRFSSNNTAIGRALVKKDFGEAAKLVVANDNVHGPKVAEALAVNERDFVGALQRLPRRTLRFYLHAYQSYLWNEVVARLLKKRCEERKVSYKQVAYSLGTFVFPEGGVPVSGAKEYVALPGFDVEYSGEVQEIVDEVLTEEELSPRDFVVKQLPNLSLTGTNRALWQDVRELTIGKPAPDELHADKEKQVLSFTLRKASYATILVKAFFA